MKTSSTEIKELGIAWLTISFAFGVGVFRFSYQGVLISFLTIGIAFIFHELAHKVVAQHYGCWAEFRMNVTMLTIMVIIAFMGVVFAAPGAVMIQGLITKNQNGKISLAGPLANIILAFLLFFPLTLLEGVLHEIGVLGVRINLWIALFNLIPFGPLDGRKVFEWDKGVYLVTLTIAAAAFLFSMLRL